MADPSDRTSEAAKGARPNHPDGMTQPATTAPAVPPLEGGANTGRPSTAQADAPHTSAPPPPASPPSHLLRIVLVLAAVLIGLTLGAWFLVPWLILTLNTVSTDDAFVNGHVTFVAPRVAGQVMKDGVLVDNNNRVRKGDVLVKLDKTPFQIVVDQKRAALATAQAQARASVGLSRGNRFKLEHAIEEVDNQIALLRANIASLRTYQAKLVQAKADFDRAKETAKTPGAISPQELDKYQAAFQVAEAQVTQALETVYQIRVGLGLPATPERDVLLDIGASTPGLLAAPLGWGPLVAAAYILPQRTDDLTRTRPDLDQTFSGVRQAEGELLQSASTLGIVPTSYDLKPRELVEDFYKRYPEAGGDIDRIYAEVLRNAPAVKQAEHDLAQAELNLSYCEVVAEIDGQVTNRNVNPGNNVQVGQSLMAVRSLTEIWIDANFKETQLANLRIGQRVRVEADMYGARQEFQGRITGFTYGTGSTLALLPPENATGNFVKIVQRLPVRVEIGSWKKKGDGWQWVTDYDPDKTPLFAGLSVTPYVYYKEPAIGPDAGKVLQPFAPLPTGPPEPKP